MTRLPKNWNKTIASKDTRPEHFTNALMKHSSEDVLEAIAYVREHLDEDHKLTLEDCFAFERMFASCGPKAGLQYHLALVLNNPHYPAKSRGETKEEITADWNARYANGGPRVKGVNMNAFFDTVRKFFPDFILKRDDDSLEHKLGMYMVEKLKGQLIWDSSYVKASPINGWMKYQDGRFKLMKGGGISRIYDQVVASAIQDGLIRREQKKQAEQQKTKDAVLKWAREGTELEVSPEQLDAQPFLLNMKNGTLDLETGKLLDHSPEYLLTKVTRVKYDADAECPKWEKFVSDISDEDKDTARCIQTALGYTLTGSVDEDAGFTLYGGGSNGKSVFVNAIARLMGDYQVRMNIETLTAQQRSGSDHSEDVFRLKGARFVYTTEPKVGYTLNEGRFKQFCGGENLTARTLNQASVEFAPEFKLWICTNHLLKLDTVDKAIKRRMVIIHILHEFDGKKSRTELVRYFVENEGPAIFAWMLKGCLAWQKHHPIKKSKAIQAATDQYLEDENEVAQFVKRYCVKGGAFKQVADEVYTAYVNHVKVALSMREFNQRLRDLEFKVDNGTGNVTTVFGLRLMTDQERKSGKVAPQKLKTGTDDLPE